MTLRCARCGEPWTMDSLHTETADRCRERGIVVDNWESNSPYSKVYDEVRKDFYARGCEALGNTHTKGGQPTEAAALIYELSGYDIDGAASDLEDFGHLLSD